MLVVQPATAELFRAYRYVVIDGVAADLDVALAQGREVGDDQAFKLDATFCDLREYSRDQTDFTFVVKKNLLIFHLKRGFLTHVHIQATLGEFHEYLRQLHFVWNKL